MLYSFTEKDADTTILKYKDKEYEIKRDIELVSKLQDVNNKARTKMYVELTKQGIKREDLIITTKKDGKTYVDNSNLTALEKSYIDSETINLMNDICKKYFDMNLEELVLDIGLDPITSQEFGTRLGEAISGKKTPSQEK